VTITIERITPQTVFEMAQHLSPADLRWLREQLDQLLAQTPLSEELLPEQATLEEAIALFLADTCSLGRAAELAGVTRWDLQDELKARGIPIYGGDPNMTLPEMEAQIERFEAMGLL
jgi:predicted HTH domain antitoxin